MKIALLGYDTEGKATYDYLLAQGHDLYIHDRDTELQVPDPSKAVLGFDEYLEDLDQYDSVVRTAGLPPIRILEKNPDLADKITSHVNEFMQASPTKNIIGVTGTKGKGTTSSLIAEMLKAAGKDVHIGGNIGIPPLTFLDKLTPESWVVLELSSFQLMDFKQSPPIAVCVMMAPEHLNWHLSMDEYVEAKSNLFARQQPSDIAIYLDHNETSKHVAAAGKGQKIPYFAAPGAHVEGDTIAIDGQSIVRVDELKLLGQHNWQNVCAALTAVWQVTQDIDAIRSVLTTFAGLPFRLEMTREFDGVRYYNDSFGTTPETATVAMEAFSEPEILILGGRTKNIPFDNLAHNISRRNNIKAVITIGETGSEIADRLRAHGFDKIITGGDNITEIVKQAHEAASPGDVVVFSPASTSFDMFKDYKDRGQQFSAAVQALA